MIVVNLFGAPGAGKSTGAACIFSQLKMKGYNVELVTEFAKDKVWEEDKGVFKDQLYIFAKQNFRLKRVEGKVDVVITDSPILLSLIYNDSYGQSFDYLVKDTFNNYNNVNFFVKRFKKYNPIGRFQTEEESNKMEKIIENKLEEEGVSYVSFLGTKSNYDMMVTMIERVLK